MLRAPGVCSRIPHFGGFLSHDGASTFSGNILTLWSTGVKCRRNWFRRFLRTQVRREVHLECVRKLGRRAEGEVHVLMEYFRDVRTRDVHPLREVRLRHAQLLHPEKNATKERRANMVNSLQISLEFKV